jgi:hypothetical protein
MEVHISVIISTLIGPSGRKRGESVSKSTSILRAPRSRSRFGGRFGGRFEGRFWGRFRGRFWGRFWGRFRGRFGSGFRGRLGGRCGSRLGSRGWSRLRSRLWCRLGSRGRCWFARGCRSGLRSRLRSWLRSRLWSGTRSARDRGISSVFYLLDLNTGRGVGGNWVNMVHHRHLTSGNRNHIGKISDKSGIDVNFVIRILHFHQRICVEIRCRIEG